MIRYQWNHAVLVALCIGLVGCAAVSPPVSQEMRSRSATFQLPQRIEDLAGPWEYQDADSQGTIILNDLGKGAYEWEIGRFETLSVENGIWTGVWIQEGNDREGGFKLTFSNDSSVAQGEWWYTRIGKDHDPLQPGGTFRMARPSANQSAQ